MLHLKEGCHLAKTTWYKFMQLRRWYESLEIYMIECMSAMLQYSYTIVVVGHVSCGFPYILTIKRDICECTKTLLYGIFVANYSDIL